MSAGAQNLLQKLRKKTLEAIDHVYRNPDARVIAAIKEALLRERDPLARDMMQSIIDNASCVNSECIPCCQDTGSVVVFIELGDSFMCPATEIQSTIEASLEEAWQKFWLRRSIVEEPLFERKILTDSVPPIIHWELVNGSVLKVIIGLKGGGAENMAALKMMPATSGAEDIRDEVIRHVVECGGKPCPPVVVGVGLGGDFELSAIMAKRALFEDLGRPHPDERYARLEQEILEGINEHGAGVMGMGSGPTALAVHIKIAPCHIASLPLAINLDCHAHRHSSFSL